MVAIVTAADANCTTGRPVRVTSSRGYLASVVTQQTRLGSDQCPWLLSASEGQTISVYLHDFGVWRPHNSSAALQQNDPAAVSLLVDYLGGDVKCVMRYTIIFGDDAACRPVGRGVRWVRTHPHPKYVKCKIKNKSSSQCVIAIFPHLL